MKCYFLFVVSQKPIEHNIIKTEGIQHLIEEEVELKHTEGEIPLLIEKQVPHHMHKESNEIIKGSGSFVSVAIVNWIKNLVSTFGYKPFRDKK